MVNRSNSQKSNKIISDEGLAFDDVLLVPQYSEILPSQVSLATNLTRNIKLRCLGCLTGSLSMHLQPGSRGAQVASFCLFTPLKWPKYPKKSPKWRKMGQNCSILLLIWSKNTKSRVIFG